MDGSTGKHRRVLFVTHACYLDDSNGAAVASRATMQALARWGFSVEAVSSLVLELEGVVDPVTWLLEKGVPVEKSEWPWIVDARGSRAEIPPHFRLNIGGVPVTLHHGPSARPHVAGDVELAEFLGLVRRVFHRFRPDVLINYGGDLLAQEVRFLARELGCTVVFTVHNFNYLRFETFKHVDAVIAPSRFAATHYRKTMGLKCDVLPYLVDFGRARCGDRQPQHVTFVNPCVEKGVYVFARIADEVGKRRPDILFLVVESRGDEATLAGCGIDLRVRDNIFLMSHTDDPRHFWRLTRICIMPSLWWENQPLVAVEAMINGIPVIGSDRGGIPETLGSSGIALAIPERLSSTSLELPTPEEVACWVDAIIRLWDDEDFYTEHQQRALSESRRWAPEVLEPEYVRFFNEVRPRPRAVFPRPDTASGVSLSACPEEKPSIELGLRIIRQRWPEMHNECQDDPIFVLSSSWRSGTTMLQRLIVRHCFLWGEPFVHAGLIESMADHLRCFTDRWPESQHFERSGNAEEVGNTFIANLYPSVHDLLRGHQGFFERLFAEPVRRAGAERWGFKEVRLSVDNAIYLKWLFPRAKFLFLIRNPYDAWRSYAARAAKGWQWYDRWPDEPVTVQYFAAHWLRLTTSFLNDHHKVCGLVLQYENLKRGDYAAVEDYLGFAITHEAGQLNPNDGSPPLLPELSDTDRAALDDGLGVLAASLGYAYHASGQQPALAVTPPELEGVQVGTSDNSAWAAATSNSRFQGDPNDPAKCVILVMVSHHIEPACDDALRALERRGYTVRRERGYSAIDQGRNQIATNALRDGFEELMWIDSDVAFEPDAVERLRSHCLPITCGVYPKKSRRAFACNFPAETKQVLFGKIGGLVEIRYAGAGFLHTRREVYRTVQERFRLPACNERFGPSMTPFFLPAVIPDGEGHWYLAEDFSFCYRARECGYRIMADTTIRLMHIGSYAYGWEDAGGEQQRYGSYTFHIKD